MFRGKGTNKEPDETKQPVLWGKAWYRKLLFWTVDVFFCYVFWMAV